MPAKDFRNSPFVKKGVAASNSNFIAQLGSVKPLAEALSVQLNNLQSATNQIRQEYNEEALHELAEDIKVRGILEPLLVRPVSQDKYEIVAGERRFRAAKLAGLSEAPVIVRELDDENARFVMLVENIQREQLSPGDEKKFFEQLEAEYNLTAEQIGKLINKSRNYVLRRLRGELSSLQQNSDASISDKSHNKDVASLLSKISQSEEKDSSSNSPKSSTGKNTVFKFNLTSINKFTSNLSIARDVFRQPETKPSADQAKQIKQSLQDLKNQIAELEATLSDEE